MPAKEFPVIGEGRNGSQVNLSEYHPEVAVREYCRRRGILDVLRVHDDFSNGVLDVRDRMRYDAYKTAGVNQATLVQLDDDVRSSSVERLDQIGNSLLVDDVDSRTSPVFRVLLNFKFDPLNLAQYCEPKRLALKTQNSTYRVIPGEAKYGYRLMGNPKLGGVEGIEIEALAGIKPTVYNTNLKELKEMTHRDEMFKFLEENGEEPQKGIRLVGIVSERDTEKIDNFWFRTSELETVK
jgi:hypothetical protein